MENIHKEILGLMGKINIDCRDDGDFVIFDLKGQLDIYNSGELEKLIDAYVDRGFFKFIINLEKVSYLDSSTISSFLSSRQKVKKLGGYFLLVHLTGAPKEVFDMAKLHEVFELYPDVASAMNDHSS